MYRVPPFDPEALPPSSLPRAHQPRGSVSLEDARTHAAVALAKNRGTAHLRPPPACARRNLSSPEPFDLLPALACLSVEEAGGRA
jgi:hypothetical protein